MTVQQSIEKIIMLAGSKSKAAKELSVTPQTINNWLAIGSPRKPRDKGLQMYLEGFAHELAKKRGISLL